MTDGQNYAYEMTEEDQELFEKRSRKLSIYLNTAIEAREAMKVATDLAFDTGSEFGFELGAMEKETAILEKIDEVFASLTDEEEDAKLTLEIIKQVILRMGDENDE